MAKLNFLMPLKGISTKTFSMENDEWILTKQYKAGKYFKGAEIEVSCLKDAFDELKESQEYNCFMIHGAIIDGTNLSNMVRRKRPDHKDGLKPTITDRNLSLFCLDIDGYQGDINTFIYEELPKEFHTADYIYQYSSSYGLTTPTTNLKCHLFFWLSEPVHNLDIRNWIKNSGIKCIDPSVLLAAQPLYVQKRICEGAADPIKKFIGFEKKGGELVWEPEQINKNQIKNSTTKIDFDLATSVEKILTAENYHNELNGLALSLINRKVPPGTVKAMLKGAMNAAPVKDERWKERYDDIERSVDSAADIVNNPSIEEILAWVQDEDTLTVKAGYAQRCIHLSPMDKTTAVAQIIKKIGFGARDVQKTIKLAEEAHIAEARAMAIEARTAERESRGIFEIECTASNSGECAEKSGTILARSEKKPEVFVMGGCLASVVMGQPKTIQQCSKLHTMGIDYPKMPLISAYRKPFYKLGGRLEKDIVYINEKGQDIPASTGILHMIGDAENLNFKPLTGVVEHPFIDNKLNLIQRNGYNSKTGLYTVLHHKLKLTQMKPEKALKYITEEVFDEFPFANELDKIVAVAALMTAVQRPTIAGDTGMPGFGIVSPTQSSGKTTLAQLLSYSVYNRPVAAQSWTEDEEELGKHLLGIFQEGHSCVLFDNIPQGSAIQSGRLANAMSNDMFGGRQLGENKVIQVPSSVIWIFTGNGISFVGDFATRIYPININPRMEAPDTRMFKRPDIGQWTMDNRKKILSAVLSIIYAGKGVGEISGSTRFKEWDIFVRRPLFQVCGIDVNEAIKKNQKDDLTKIVKINLLQQLFEEFGTVQFTTKQILKSAFGSFESGETALGDALVDALGNKSKNTMSVGRYLGALVDNVFGDLTMVKYMSNMVNWQIIKVDK